jgi:hypothetical protein
VIVSDPEAETCDVTMQYPGSTKDGMPAIKYLIWDETTDFADTLYIGPLFLNLR